jgi:predicted nucleic acid-binding protein
MHNINLAEVYSIVHQKEGRESAYNALERLKQSPIQFFSTMDENFLNALATIRTKYKTHFTDTFVIAANHTLTQNGTILTADSDFEKVEDIASILYFR